MKKNYILCVILILLIVIVALLLAFCINPNNEKKVIGGDKDEHGCLIGAGYSWNETEEKCVREWSNESDRYQIINPVRE